jgi:hypothetical protein
MSQTSAKSVKQINASLERIHTFGMSSIHKSRHDIEKIDNQYDSMISGEKMRNSGSFAKLKNVIKNNLENASQKMKFINPKNIMSDMGDDQSDGFSDDVPKGPIMNI